MDLIKNLEKEHNFKVLYLTKYGSKLYGTDNKNSDTDYKGIFISSIDDILLKKDKEHWTSKASNIKNTKDDVDIQLFSLHKFFDLLKKGETGALDLLFSMFSPSIVYKDELFVDSIKMYYKEFLNRRLHSFTGYSVGQAKRYGIKGTRYKELVNFKDKYQRYQKIIKRGDWDDYKLSVMFNSFKKYFQSSETKYLKMVKAPGPKTGKGENIIDYVEILGKKFSGDVTIGYFFDKIKNLEKDFGNRTKASAEGVDWKALSHSVRVLFEVEELLDTGFITFPLKDKDYVKQVKENKKDITEVMDFINLKLDEIKEKLDKSFLPENSNTEKMDELILYFIKAYDV